MHATATMSRKSFVAGTAGLALASAAGSALTLCASASTVNSDESTRATGEDVSGLVTAERDFDVVVCGAGAAGLAAACAAAQEGASVVCLEKCSFPYAPGTNYGFANVPEFFEAGAEPYDEVGYIDELLRGMDGMGDPAIYSNFVKANPEVGSWMLKMAEERGHEYIITAPLSSVEFKGVYDMMTEELEANGGELVCSMGACQLVTDEGGAVVAVIARNMDTDEYVRFNAARGVVLPPAATAVTRTLSASTSRGSTPTPCSSTP